MTAKSFREALEVMNARRGILGCALVDLGTGMVWHATGSLASDDSIASFASDYWRLYQRSRPVFSPLGDLRIAMLMHSKEQLTMRECGRNVLLVIVTAQVTSVDWNQWKDDHSRLAELVNRF